ncbi:MAG: phosphodiester glycosidase family protein [Firmicutes bacterium]|nr:phosphodiester glycosidase family protein [Bacillota bacterium]
MDENSQNTTRIEEQAPLFEEELRASLEDPAAPQPGETSPAAGPEAEKPKYVKRVSYRQKRKKKHIFAKFLLVVFTTVIAIALALVVTVATIVNGPSETARDTLVTTVLESGNLKFVASIFLTPEEINAIVSKTSMKEMDTHIDEGLIETDAPAEGNFDENGVEIIELNGRSFHATLMIVADPSKVIVGSTYPWSEYGKELSELVGDFKAIGGINGGLYAADGNKGGRPYGLCVSMGEVQLNNPAGWAGLYLIGFDKNNLLRIEKIEGWTQTQLKEFIADEGIRDAVAFQDEASDSNNHFVPIVINGEARELNGAGSGANPRTVIGQRADGAVLLLVTDGRGSGGHLGATASDLISIMLQYGAVNAANLDGGSSSCMYYEDEYLMTSVTLYYANSSWKLPTAFLVMGGEQ